MDAELPIVKVTVLEDRAHVVRRGRLELHAGANRVQVRDVSPILSDKTLYGSVVEGKAKVVDVRVEREVLRLLEDRTEPDRALRAALERAHHEHRELESECARRRAELEELDSLARLGLAEVAEDVRWGRSERARWEQELRELEHTEASRLAELLGVERRLDDSARALADLQRRAAVAQSPASSCRATAVLELVCEADASVMVQLEYLTAGACWRPYHRATLSSEQDSLELRTDACVWQNTGELWENVLLALSTERASLGTEPPLLSGELLRTQRKSAVLQVSTREQQVTTAGLGHEEGAGPGTAAGREAPTLLGIDDGGEVRLFRPERKVTVASDGRPCRVELFTFTAPAKTELVVMPELAEAVLLKSVQSNTGSWPLLAGPVDLLRSSGLCGRTKLHYIAPGERFELGWGPEASLRVHREIEVLPAEERALSSWTSVAHRVRVRLSNLGPAARKVRVRERIPVSELEKVVIELDPEHSAAGAKADEDGIVRLKVSLPPYGRHLCELAYTVKRHSDVVGL